METNKQLDQHPLSSTSKVIEILENNLLLNVQYWFRERIAMVLCERCRCFSNRTSFKMDGSFRNRYFRSKWNIQAYTIIYETISSHKYIYVSAFENFFIKLFIGSLMKWMKQNAAEMLERLLTSYSKFFVPLLEN